MVGNINRTRPYDTDVDVCDTALVESWSQVSCFTETFFWQSPGLAPVESAFFYMLFAQPWGLELWFGARWSRYWVMEPWCSAEAQLIDYSASPELRSSLVSVAPPSDLNISINFTHLYMICNWSVIFISFDLYWIKYIQIIVWGFFFFEVVAKSIKISLIP